MAEYRVGIIGAGKPHRSEGSTGFGMSHQHVKGYQEAGRCKFVAVADIVPENAKAFQDTYGFERTYGDYHEMLAKENLDIVSVCTWPILHGPMVIACAEAGVKAVHCEKPIAESYGEAKRMVDACAKSGTQLTFNHQRRFLEPFQKARALVREKAIGDLYRIESVTANMYDWGTHWFDMMFFFNDETPADWVIGQIDLRGLHKIFGAPIEGQGISSIKFRNDVYGLMQTGHEAPKVAEFRLLGSDGVIEVAPRGGPHLRIRGKGDADWREIPCAESIHGDAAIYRGIVELVDSLDAGREPELSGRKALQATEVIFATYESSLRRGRIDLPLEADESALKTLMAEAGLS